MKGSFSRSSDIPVTGTGGPQELHVILEVPLRFLLTINPIVALIKGSVPLHSIQYGLIHNEYPTHIQWVNEWFVRRVSGRPSCCFWRAFCQNQREKVVSWPQEMTAIPISLLTLSFSLSLWLGFSSVDRGEARTAWLQQSCYLRLHTESCSLPHFLWLTWLPKAWFKFNGENVSVKNRMQDPQVVFPVTQETSLRPMPTGWGPAKPTEVGCEITRFLEMRHAQHAEVLGSLGNC